QVLSHNLYTVLCIPHDPVALEEHFRDDDDGPVSSQGYMPYLNKYILDKVSPLAIPLQPAVSQALPSLVQGCQSQLQGSGLHIISHQDAFKLWCLFNFLSEDKYPLVMVPDEVEYLLKKICTAMNVELNSCELDDYFSQEPEAQGGLTVWQFLDMVNSGRFLRGIEQEAVSMAVEEVYQEVIEDVLKQGYLWKRGQLRRNWSERWFTLKPSVLSYYMSEERKEKKGSITLDKHCCVEVLPDRDGKRCMFCVKTSSRTYEMSASDTRQRQEWTLAIQTAIRLQAEGKKSLHKDLKQKRREQREQREQRKAAKEEETQRLKQLQEEKERKLQGGLEEVLGACPSLATMLLPPVTSGLPGALRGLGTRDRGSAPLCRKRILELEDMRERLQEALQQEVKARQDEESVRYAQARLLAEEEEKLKQLMKLKEEQEEYIIKTQREKQVLKQEMENKNKWKENFPQSCVGPCRSAGSPLFSVPSQVAQRKLRQASTNVKHWNVQMNRLMHPIGPGDKRTNVSGGGFAGYQPFLSQRDSSLKLRQKAEDKSSDPTRDNSKENVSNGGNSGVPSSPDADTMVTEPTN
ncbi:Differentially expressed in FDCP 6, partial [Phalacrocorax carbo]